MDKQEMDKMMEMLKTMADDHNKMMAKMEANSRADREEMKKKNGSQPGEGGQNLKRDAVQDGGRTEIRRREFKELVGKNDGDGRDRRKTSGAY
jgi:hypothetical protein